MAGEPTVSVPTGPRVFRPVRWPPEPASINNISEVKGCVLVANETSITVVGNLTDEPDLRFLPTGSALCRFTVASTPRVFDSGSGQWRDGEALFMLCTAWRDLAVHAAESLSKGMRVVVVGRLRQWRYETPEGEKRSGYGLEVDEVGPSLRFATAKVSRMSRARNGNVPEAPPDDAWASASRERPVPAGAGV